MSSFPDSAEQINNVKSIINHVCGISRKNLEVIISYNSSFSCSREAKSKDATNCNIFLLYPFIAIHALESEQVYIELLSNLISISIASFPDKCVILEFNGEPIIYADKKYLKIRTYLLYESSDLKADKFTDRLTKFINSITPSYLYPDVPEKYKYSEIKFSNPEAALTIQLLIQLGNRKYTAEQISKAQRLIKCHPLELNFAESESDIADLIPAILPCVDICRTIRTIHFAIDRECPYISDITSFLSTTTTVRRVVFHITDSPHHLPFRGVRSTCVREVEICGRIGKRAVGELLEVTKHAPLLRTLEFTSALTEDGFNFLVNNLNLKRLRIRGFADWTPKAVDVLGPLQKANVDEIFIGNCDISLKDALDFINSSKAESVGFEGVDTSLYDTEFELKRPLREVRIVNTKWTRDPLIAFLKGVFGHTYSDITLDLSGSSIPANDWEYILSETGSMKSVYVVGLILNNIPTLPFEFVSNITNFPRLKELRLRGCLRAQPNLSTAVADLLASNMQCLRILDIGDNALGEDRMRNISDRLITNQSLTEVHLDGHNSEVPQFFKILRDNRRLAYINFDGPKIDARKVKLVADDGKAVRMCRAKVEWPFRSISGADPELKASDIGHTFRAIAELAAVQEPPEEPIEGFPDPPYREIGGEMPKIDTSIFESVLQSTIAEQHNDCMVHRIFDKTHSLHSGYVEDEGVTTSTQIMDILGRSGIYDEAQIPNDNGKLNGYVWHVFNMQSRHRENIGTPPLRRTDGEEMIKRLEEMYPFDELIEY